MYTISMGRKITAAAAVALGVLAFGAISAHAQSGDWDQITATHHAAGKGADSMGMQVGAGGHGNAPGPNDPGFQQNWGRAPAGGGAAGGAGGGYGSILDNQSCYVDMPAYDRNGKFVGRGLINTCY